MYAAEACIEIALPGLLCKVHAARACKEITLSGLICKMHAAEVCIEIALLCKSKDTKRFTAFDSLSL